jgi:hypothetical protein
MLFMPSPYNTPCLNCGETKYSIRRDGVDMCALPGTMYEADDHIGYEYKNHRWAGWSDRELAAIGVEEADYERFRHTKRSVLKRNVHRVTVNTGRELLS